MVFSAEDALGLLPEFNEEEDPSLVDPLAPEDPLMTEPIQSAEEVLGSGYDAPPEFTPLEPTETLAAPEDILGADVSVSPESVVETLPADSPGTFQIKTADEVLGSPIPQPGDLPSQDPLAQPEGPVNLGLDTPYTQTNIMYELYMDTLNDEDQFNMSEEEVSATERSLAAQFVSDVYVDATSAMAGGRKFDEQAEKYGASVGSRNYRSQLGKISSSLAESSLIELKPLVDREDYAEYAIERVVQQLHEAGAPTSLLRAITKEYRKTKDDFDDLTDADVFVTAEAIKNRTARTWSQLLSIPLNAIITPVAFAAAGAAGLTRNPGEPNDNLPYLQQATAEDVKIYESPNILSRVDSAQRIANRSYVQDTKSGSPIKLHTSDVIHIMDNIGSWQAGLSRHINKKVKELGPAPVSIHPNRLGFIDARRDPKKIYNFLKEFGALSYHDAMNTWAAPFLEGYDPIKPPEGGWVWEAASREASGKTAEQLKKAGLIPTEKTKGKTYEKGETPPFWEFLEESVGSITVADIARSANVGFRYGGAAATPMSTIQTAEALLNRADNLPEESTKVNRARLKKQIASGAFGERLTKPGAAEAALQIIDRGATNSAMYSSQLREFTRNMLTMMGPEETAKAMVMAVGGFKKYGLPSLLPVAEVGGVLSGEDVGVFGNDDILPVMSALGITDEDVELFWKDNPGFAAAMIPGATNPLGKIASAGVKGTGAVVRAMSRVGKDNTLTSAQKLRALSAAVVEEYGFLGEELDMAETTRVASKDREERIYTPNEDDMTPVDQTATSLRAQADEASAMAAKIDENDSSAKTYNEVADAARAAADALEESQRLQEMEMMQSGGTQEILKGVIPTMDVAATMEGPARSKDAPRVSPENPVIKRRTDEMRALVDEDNQRIKDNEGKKKYKSPGQRRYRQALREVAGELGYKQVNDRFMSDVVFKDRRDMARRFAENGVTDPRVLPATPARGCHGWA